MKLLSLALASLVIASTQAFVPQQGGRSISSPSSLNEESSSGKELFEPAEKVPCFGAAPFIGGEVFVGENYWNKLTSEYGSADTGDYLRAAELKHGRSAMIATVGYAFQKLGITFDKISPHEYLSVTQNVKFADLAAMSPLESVKMIPTEGWAQIFGVIAAIEIYELTHRDGEIKVGESVAPGLQSGGLTGYNLNWNPLKIKITDRRKLVEIQNGRAAMFAICAWVSEEAIPGSVPLPLPW